MSRRRRTPAEVDQILASAEMPEAVGDLSFENWQLANPSMCALVAEMIVDGAPSGETLVSAFRYLLNESKRLHALVEEAGLE
ncbi:MAG: hypothetical protein V3U22_03040 [Vicinamibacteria bacterium]